MSDLIRLTAALCQRVADGDELLLLADYDGTLTPIVPDPRDAWLDGDVRETLGLLTSSPRMRVGIVSGRSLADVRFRVGLPTVVYAGCHGLEMEGPSIRFRHATAEAARAELSGVAEALGRRLAAIPGAFVEPKGLAVAVHFRNAPAAARPSLEAEITEVLRSRPGLRVLPGNQVVDILPAVRWGKGQCVLRIRERLAPLGRLGVSCIYLGDDETDETAFHVLAGHTITVRVGGTPGSAAAYRLRDVAEVHALLATLSDIVVPGGHR